MSRKNLQSLKASENAKRMNLAEWRASRLHELTLPSGLVVTVRDCDLTDLMLAGKLPDAILDAAEITVGEKKNQIDLAKIGRELIKTNGPEFARLLNLIITAALVEPKIGEVPDDTHITLNELNLEDKVTIMDWVDREAPKLESFREGQDEPVATVQPGNGLRKTSE